MVRRLHFLSAAAAAATLGVALSLGPAMATSGTSEVPSTGHPSSPFPQNKQNEPAIAVDLNPNDPSGVLIAGANDEIDLQPCFKTGNPASSYPTGSCPFTPGVGVSGVYFSTDGGSTWTQPTYMGYSARTTADNSACLLTTCTSPTVTPGVGGRIGTVPNYYEAGLVSGGDPGLAIGPRPSGRRFDWANGSRFYYSNLMSNFPGSSTLTVQEAVGVSHFDTAGDGTFTIPSQTDWSAPAIASGRQNPVLFDDKPAIWVDNAASSRFFGRVYVTWTGFRAANAPNPFEPEPIMSAFSTDGGVTWSTPVQISPAADSPSNGRQGSTIRTDSHGNVYVAWEGFTRKTGPVQMLSISRDGGHVFSTPRPIALVRDVGVLDPIQGRLLFDGIQGARTDSFPSLDVANGAPTGRRATDQLVLAWSDNGQGQGDSNLESPGRTGSEESLLITSTDGGFSWSSSPTKISAAGDRPDFTAVAIKPDGSTVYVTYDAFLQGYQTDWTSARNMQGVVREATVTSGTIGDFADDFRGTAGDARGSSQNNLLLEFLGDYNDIVANNSGPFAIFNDARNETDCGPANMAGTVDWYRVNWEAAIAAATTPPQQPFVPPECPSTFGNLNVFN